jgi:hypothetical protein
MPTAETIVKNRMNLAAHGQDDLGGKIGESSTHDGSADCSL